MTTPLAKVSSPLVGTYLAVVAVPSAVEKLTPAGSAVEPSRSTSMVATRPISLTLKIGTRKPMTLSLSMMLRVALVRPAAMPGVRPVNRRSIVLVALVTKLSRIGTVKVRGDESLSAQVNVPVTGRKSVPGSAEPLPAVE